MIIETIILKIVPLTVAQFSLLLNGVDKMENVGINPIGRILKRTFATSNGASIQKSIS